MSLPPILMTTSDILLNLLADQHVPTCICQYMIKESFSFKTRMPGTVKCRPTVAY